MLMNATHLNAVEKLELLMRLASCLVVMLLLSPFAGNAQTQFSGLPRGAQVIESRRIDSATHGERTIVLWMLRPSKNPRETEGEIYTCPEYTRGSYYRGATRVSLFDGERLVNTIRVGEEYEGDESPADSFDLPYRIQQGFYYTVKDVPAETEGAPTILDLKDYNGDGTPYEFALFDALACMGLPTTIIGYSERQDRAIQYPIRLTARDAGKRAVVTTERWADYLFSEQPIRPGFWQYEIDYRGRGGTLDRWTVRYNKRLERFDATLVRVFED